MAASLALASTKVSEGGVVVADKAMALVRANVFTATERGRVTLRVPGVVSVVRTSPAVWTVTVEGGRVFTVERVKGCGCGR